MQIAVKTLLSQHKNYAVYYTIFYSIYSNLYSTMNVHFYINFHTHLGQYIALELHAADTVHRVPMHLDSDAHTWHTAADLKGSVSYNYVLIDDNYDSETPEWGKTRSVTLPEKVKGKVVVRDYWRAADRLENPLFTSAFYNAVFQQGSYIAPKATKANARVQLSAPRCATHQQYCLLIDLDGNDNAAEREIILLGNENYPTWSADLSLDMSHALRYKYGIYNTHTKSLDSVETGDERWLSPDAFTNGNFHIVTDEAFQFADGNWRGAGVAVPVFALRTETGMGVGEFKDIKLLADWSERTNMKMIQILPINDTTSTHTWTDSYPYAAITIYALHPMYLNIPDVGAFPLPESEAEYIALRDELNALGAVDYERVMQAKWRFGRLMYEVHGAAHFKTQTYKKFFEDNKKWLMPYAVFSHLRDENGTGEYDKWGEFAVYDEALITEKLLKPRSKSLKNIQYHYFMQYHLHLQLLEAADYARAKGILMKGDIPIGIYRYSVDAWTEPRYFNLNGQAGAPPDSYSATGQNWGLPTYDWHVMAQDGYAWWRSRLQHSSKYFEAFRIDHILGFFRIWEIPSDCTYGMMGRFNPAWGINANEFAGRGIHLDYERFCTPYIRDYMFETFFGHEAEYIKHTYFEHYGMGKFRFRENVDTQQKVATVFATSDNMHDDERAWKTWVQQAMLELHAEVLLFEAPFSNREAFHPRIELYKTHSFQALNNHEKHELAALHNDYFYGKQEPLWRAEAEKRLPAVTTATDMLICGEDLGMVPQSVPDVMNKLQMLSLEIQRMPKGYGQEFGRPEHYPYWSVCSPSCHDMSNIRGWYEEDRDRAQRFYNNILGHEGSAPFFCETWIVEEILQQHLHSPAMWAVFPIQDLTGAHGYLRHPQPATEQINNPGNSKHYWRYRFHIDLENLLLEDGFNDYIGNMVKGAGRG